MSGFALKSLSDKQIKLKKRNKNICLKIYKH